MPRASRTSTTPAAATPAAATPPAASKAVAEPKATTRSDAKVSDAKVSDAKVSDAKVSGGKVSDAKAPDAKVSGAKVSGGKVSGGKVSGGKVSGAKVSGGKASGGKGRTAPFAESQRRALLDERGTYVRQADELQAQADSLALEHEPGDVQFDEEGGEGGTSNVDRELDLLLSSQARGTVEEIDRALAKIDAGTYGRCEQCGQQIPEARLEALPHASLCVVCKAGGLSSRR